MSIKAIVVYIRQYFAESAKIYERLSYLTYKILNNTYRRYDKLYLNQFSAIRQIKLSFFWVKINAVPNYYF